MKRLKERLLNRETITYVIFGILTTLVNFVIYYGLLHLKVHYMIATPLAWVVAVLFAYFTNKHFVFFSHDYSPGVLLPELGRFALGRLITLLLEQGFLYVAVELLKGSERLMKLFAAVAVVILNYIFSKLFIFKNNTEKKEYPDDDEN